MAGIAIVFGDEVAFTEYVGAGSADGMLSKNVDKDELAVQQIEHRHDTGKRRNETRLFADEHFQEHPDCPIFAIVDAVICKQSRLLRTVSRIF